MNITKQYTVSHHDMNELRSMQLQGQHLAYWAELMGYSEIYERLGEENASIFLALVRSASCIVIEGDE